jgi:regulator of RNase E activity RraA
MSTSAKILGAHGALVDGFARDTDGIKALGLSAVAFAHDFIVWHSGLDRTRPPPSRQSTLPHPCL